MTGLSTMGSISFGTALEAGRNRVPRPAAGITALRTRVTNDQLLFHSIATPRQPAQAGSRPATPALRLADVPANAPHALPWWRDRTRSWSPARPRSVRRRWRPIHPQLVRQSARRRTPAVGEYRPGD